MIKLKDFEMSAIDSKRMSLQQYCEEYVSRFNDTTNQENRTDAAASSFGAVDLLLRCEAILERSVNFLTSDYEPELLNGTRELICRFNEVHWTNEELRNVFAQVAGTVHQLVRYINHIQALAIRFELVRVVDAFVDDRFKLHRAQLPGFLNGDLVQLADGLLVNRLASQQSEKLRLAGEYIRDGERWLREGCEPVLYAENHNFCQLSNKLLERLSRPRKLKLTDKLALVQEFDQLHKAMEEVCETEYSTLIAVPPAGPFEVVEKRVPERFFQSHRDNFDKKALRRAECLVAKVEQHFGSYSSFLEFATAAKDDRNGVLHVEALCELT